MPPTAADKKTGLVGPVSSCVGLDADRSPQQARFFAARGGVRIAPRRDWSCGRSSVVRTSPAARARAAVFPQASHRSLTKVEDPKERKTIGATVARRLPQLDFK